MDRPSLGNIRRRLFIHRISQQVEHSSQALFAYRHGNRSAGIHSLCASHQTIGGIHGDAADRIIAGLLSHLRRKSLSVMIDLYGIQKGRQLVVDSDHAHVRGNPEMLERLCSILLENAVKYTAEHGEILFAVRQDRMVTVYTENIPLEPLDEAMCAHLFDRFYRADHARSKGRKGYGIGLAIAQAIVQKHGGEARAEKRGNVLRIACVLPAEKERK